MIQKRTSTLKRQFKLFNTLFLLLVFTVSAFGKVPDIGAGSVKLKVLTFNIYHGATMKGDFDLDLIASVIKKLDPDLVALQEVDFKTNRAKKMDLVTELGIRTGMAPLFGKAMTYDGGEYGEGILSKYSFQSTKVHPLEYTKGHEPRAALEVVVKLSNGDVISFIGTHLDHEAGSPDRVLQAKQLNELLNSIHHPALLAGDLNAEPGSEPINILTQKWTMAAGDNIQATYPSSGPAKKIDYIMYAPLNRWRVLETRVVDEKVASDHSPYFVILELLPEE